MKISNCSTKIVKDFDWSVDHGRFSYLRDIVDVEWRLWIEDQLILEWEVDKSEMIEENKTLSKKLVEDIIFSKQSSNKNLEIQLKSFVSDFIFWLSEEELAWLRSIVQYYMKNVMFSDDEWKKAELLAWHTMSRFDSIWEKLVYLLRSTVLLPVVASQTEFNKQLHWIINRLERKIEKNTINHWLVIDPVNVLELYNNMMDTQTFAFSGWIWLNWVISWISWDCDMWLMNPERRTENLEPGEMKLDENRMFLNFAKVWDDWVSRAELYKMLRVAWFPQRDEWVFLINSWYDVNILLQVQNPYISYTSEWSEIETFQIEFFAEPKKKLTSEKYLESSVKKLIENIQVLSNMIYFNFWLPEFQNRVNLDLTNYFIWYRDDFEDDSEGWQALWQNTLRDGIAGLLTNKTNNSNDKNSNDVEGINKLDFDSIILEDKEIAELKLLVDTFKNFEYLRKHWVNVPKWTIFYWPPWTWKTLSVRVISDIINAHFMPISHTDIESKWVWESEQNIKKQFNEARKKVKEWKKVIMFFDEADSLFEARSWTKNHKEWIINVILSEMDWFDQSLMDNIFVIFSTNRLAAVDWALKSRFNKHIWYSLPSKEKRVEHFYLNVWREEETAREKIFDKIDYDLLADKTDWKSGRFIAKLIDNAKLRYYLKKINSEWDNIWYIDNDFILKEIETLEEEEKKETRTMWFKTDND